jgi:hypothetical protein
MSPTPAKAIEAAELAEAEVRHRNQLARELAKAAYVRGHVHGYLLAVADFKAHQHGLVRDTELEGTWRPRLLRRPAAGRLPRPSRA